MVTHIQHRARAYPYGEATSGLAPPSTAPAEADTLISKPNFWRLIVVATVVTSLLLMIGITVAVAAGENTGWVEGFGVALFSTLWGGPGFGLMIGGSMWIERWERWEAQQFTA